MGIQERRLKDREEIRRKILAAAAALLEHEGPEQVSIRKIAAKIDYSPAAIYMHFENKSEIVAILCRDVFLELDATLERIGASGADPAERLRRALRAYVDFGVAHPRHYAAALGETETAVAPVFQRIKASLQAYTNHPDVEVAAQATWIMLHGLTTSLIGSRTLSGARREALIDHTLSRIAGGLSR